VTHWLPAALALALIVGLLMLPPHGLLAKADRAAFAVCHQIPERTITVAGRPLPLCARCSGTYLGALAALGVLSLRGRFNAGRLPARPYLLIFGMFITLWAIDGLNSYLTFFPGAPHLYEPRNTLRLVTGTMQGVALAAIMAPLVNRSLRAHPTEMPSLENIPDFLWLLSGGAFVALLIRSDQPILLYPLAIVSGLAVVALATLVNLLFLESVSERVRRSPARVTIIAWSSLLALGELAAIGVARSALEARVGPLP
jgi:uncharacterized membrane protein